MFSGLVGTRETVVWSLLQEIVVGAIALATPPLKYTFDALKLPMSMGLLNCMLNTEFTGTFVWPFCTLLLITKGAVKSGCAAVVKLVEVVAALMPAWLVTPLTANVIAVLGGNGAWGDRKSTRLNSSHLGI